MLNQQLQKSVDFSKMPVMRLWQHDNGIWYVTLRRGKHKSLATKDKGIAEEIFEKMEKLHLQERLFILEKKNFLPASKFKAEYLARRTDKDPDTQRADKLALTKFVEWYGDRPVAGISKRKCEAYRLHLFSLGLKPNAINNYLRHLKGAIKYALDEGYIPSVIDSKPNNPLEGLKQYTVDHSQKIWLEKEEVTRLIETAQKYPDIKTVVPVMVYTGMPRQVAVSSIIITGHEIQYRRGKTQKLINVPICDELRPYIAHLGLGIHVLANMHPDTLGHKFAAIVKEAGIAGGVSAHKLRHTFATLLLEAGVDIATVSALLGHSDINITLKFYGHIKPGLKKKAVSLLNFKRGV